MKTTTRTMQTLAITALLMGCGSGDAVDSQEVHPGKVAFADAQSWPALGVGDAALMNFQPFRAVYERVYSDMNGQERRDHVIILAERVAWNETPAISVSLIDAGNNVYDDTAMRIQTRVFAEDDHRMLLYIAPVPGTPRDYMIAHTDGTARVTSVEAESGDATQQTDIFPLPQLGAPGLWLLGSMMPEPDAKVAFANAHAPAPSSILGANPVIVRGEETVDAGPLGTQRATVVVYPLGMTNGRVMHNFVTDRPPYLLGKRPLDLDTGETTEMSTLRLVEFSAFGQGR